MKVPESWLRSMVNPDIGTQQLADVLTMAGLEVEEQVLYRLNRVLLPYSDWPM